MAEQTQQMGVARPALRAHPQRLPIHRRTVQDRVAPCLGSQSGNDLLHPPGQLRLQPLDGNPSEDPLHGGLTRPLRMGEAKADAPRLTVVLRPISDPRLPPRSGEHRHAGKQEQGLQ